MKKTADPITVEDIKKNFIKDFQALCKTRSAWQVWSDFITMTACAIANNLSSGEPEIRKAREDEYIKCAKRFDKTEINLLPRLFTHTIQALELNPEQDFLGNIFTHLNLNSHWHGQFFTPIHIGKFMSRITLSAIEIENAIEKQGYISINDCACGAGSLLIAAANRLREDGINYQQKALFVAQDIDRIAGLMCYIQLSLLGCAGYIVIADTISNPVVYADDSSLFPLLKEEQEIWFTPMFFSDEWVKRHKTHFVKLADKH